MWTSVGLHSGAKVKVGGFVFTTPEGPQHQSNQIPEPVIFQFPHIDKYFSLFLPNGP